MTDTPRPVTMHALGVTPGAGPTQMPPVYDVRDLIVDGREAVLLHDGQAYRLRITANHKLILTK